MATFTPATLQNLEESIHSMYEGNISYPVPTDDDYVLRLNLLNIWINQWENSGATDWRELWKNDTSLTYVAPAVPANGNIPTVFTISLATLPVKRLGGFIFIKRISDSQLVRIPVYDAHVVQTRQPQDLFAYVIGTPVGYSLVIRGVDPTFDGGTIIFDYYSFATKLTATTDYTECPDPGYLIYGVVSQLHANNRNTVGYTVASTEAEDRITNMIIANELAPHYQDQSIEDDDSVLNHSGFGY